MKISSRLPLSYFTVTICFGFIFFLLVQKSPACSWDYLIWQNRAKNSDPYYRFIKDGQAGFIDQSGKIVINPTLPVYGNYQNGVINGLLDIDSGKYIEVKTGKEVSRDYFYQNTELLDELSIKSLGDKFGFVDRQGNRVIESKFVYAKNFSEGLAPVVLEGPCFYYSSESPCPGSDAFPVGTKVQPTTACQFSFINKKGKLISAQTFLDVKEFSEDLAPVKTAEGWGYINRKGKIVIAPQFENAEPFSEGLGLVKRDNLYGYIDLSGAFVIEPQFEVAEYFTNGLAPVGKYKDKTIDNEFYYINKNGKPAFSGKFLLASHYFKGLAHVLVSETLTVEKKDDEELQIRKRTYAYINNRGKKIFVYTVEDEM